ncbi:hypothetical protein THOG11_390005 [Vibrio harveyi]|nr:hypothetical protein TH15OA1_370006 [Vibrio harveyi]CAH1572715.1 hypothetical protein THOD03_450005 [Vibrio harveyi]CAH1575224.1 hypothetical protein THOG11_390005 [Vibrio harveyi]
MTKNNYLQIRQHDEAAPGTVSDQTKKGRHRVPFLCCQK